MEKTMDSRSKNSTRNIIFSMLSYLIQIILGFLARRFFIFYFGEEYLGLSSLFTNVLSLLSLAELGFGSAIVFSMYKPMAEGDEEKVRQLLQFYKKCYFVIGCIILVLGLCVLPFMNSFKSRVEGVDANLYVVYGIFLFNSIISYFFAHRRSLLYTNQRNDIESKVNMVLNIVLTALQLAAIIFAKNYYFYIALTGFIGLVNNLFIFVITQKMFPQYLKKTNNYLSKEDRKEINRNIRSMIFHKIGSVLVHSTDSLIIFIVLGSAELGKYSNYLLITTYVANIIAIFTGALRGSIGNSIASESVEKNVSLLKKLNWIHFAIISFATISIYVLADPFIDVVLTHAEGVNLTFNKTILVCICINFFLTQSRYMLSMFKECAGLFYPDRYKAIIESVINLVASIILAYSLGIAGVIIGTIISTVTTSLWVEPYVTNKHYFKQSTVKYFAKYLLYVLAMLISGVVTVFVCNFIAATTFWTLILKGIVCVVVAGSMLIITMAPFKEFKECVKWGKNIIISFKKKRAVQTATVENNAIISDNKIDNNEKEE